MEGRIFKRAGLTACLFSSLTRKSRSKLEPCKKRLDAIAQDIAECLVFYPPYSHAVVINRMWFKFFDFRFRQWR